MPQVVLDASAVIALVRKEPGERVVRKALQTDATISTVNLAEVTGWLFDHGWTTEDVGVLLDELPIRELPFSSEAALVTGRLLPQTRGHNLGIADRACLATGYIERCPILTADQEWRNLNLDLDPLDIQFIRSA